MNIANVTARFAVLAEIDSADTARFSPLIEEACRYVQSMCVIGQPDSGQTARLEMLSAVYALRLYGLLGEDQLTQFVAGDVRLTSSAGRTPCSPGPGAPPTGCSALNSFGRNWQKTARI